MLIRQGPSAPHRKPVGRSIVRRGLLLAVLASALYSVNLLRRHSPVGNDDHSITLRGGRTARGEQQDNGVVAQLGRRTDMVSSKGRAAKDRGSRGRTSAADADSLAQRDALLAAWPAGKPKAALVVLARNSDVEGLASSMRQLEQRFNAKAGYPWVFLNDVPHTTEFVQGTALATRHPRLYGTVPRDHWGYPPWIDKAKAAAVRQQMGAANVVHGGDESYRFMCRYFSGFFFRHPLLDGFDFYWRVEPNVQFTCDLRHDPFAYMQAHNASYGWNIIVGEVMETIPTLWASVRVWAQANPGSVAPNNSLPGLVMGDPGEEQWYSGCHFWSNFEIGRLSFFRSVPYLQLFEHLDRAGGFFYERWGDAPVHSLAAALLLPRGAIHRFKDIGYQHGDWAMCPQEPEYRALCSCDPTKDVHRDQANCLSNFASMVGIY